MGQHWQKHFVGKVLPKINRLEVRLSEYGGHALCIQQRTEEHPVNQRREVDLHLVRGLEEVHQVPNEEKHGRNSVDVDMVELSELGLGVSELLFAVVVCEELGGHLSAPSGEDRGQVDFEDVDVEVVVVVLEVVMSVHVDDDQAEDGEERNDEDLQKLPVLSRLFLVLVESEDGEKHVLSIEDQHYLPNWKPAHGAEHQEVQQDVHYSMGEYSYGQEVASIEFLGNRGDSVGDVLFTIP